MVDYSLKGVNPFVNLVTTTTRDSNYLQSQSSDYPTAMLDFDGNERASLQFRDSDLNLLHIILQQLQRSNLPGDMRRALTDQFFATINNRSSSWQLNLNEINEELGALRRRIEQQREQCATQPKKFTKQELEEGLDEQATRVCAWLDIWMGQEANYGEYARILTNLLGLRQDAFDPTRLKIADVIAPRAMGDHNSIFQLQNYVVGIAPGGLKLKTDGSLDLEKSFARLDYYSLLRSLNVRNNVQPGISNRPVDFIVTRIPSSLVKSLVNETELGPDVVWVDAGPDRQALVLARENNVGGVSFRYIPIKNLKQDASGRLHFETSEWREGMPLQMFEDQHLNVPVANRAAWLSQWHTDQEWLRALHLTRYSNGLIGLHEQMGRHAVARLEVDAPGISADERLLRRLLRRQRQNIESDLLLIANDHWNFDVRGFNPGGNHGSFLRISTHSTLMLWGGDQTRIPRATVIDQPYDSLSFVPTVLALTGKLRDDNNPIPDLLDKGFRRFPGPLIKEVLGRGRSENQSIAGTGATTSP